MRKAVFSDKFPESASPYSPAIVASGPQVYISGQGPFDPEAGAFKLGNFKEQAEQVFTNIGTLLQDAGSSWEHVVKVNAYLSDIRYFPEFNEIYKQYFVAPYPARTTVEARFAVIGMVIEVDCVALVPQE